MSLFWEIVNASWSSDEIDALRAWAREIERLKSGAKS